MFDNSIMINGLLALIIFPALIQSASKISTSSEHEIETTTALRNGCTLTRRTTATEQSSGYITYPHYDCTKAKLKKLPTDIPTNVKSITLDHNEIEELDISELKNYAQLVHLSMTSAGLKKIIPNPNVILGSLKTLSFPLNEVNEITAEHLKSFPNVTFLRLNSNNIRNIPDDLFKYTPKIYRLYIGPNRLDSFNEDSLKYLKRVFSLSLQNISLTNVPRLDMPILKYLELSDNQITEVKRDSFVGCPSLELISLDNNAISDIAQIAFRSNSKLRNIDLSENKITRLREGVFDYDKKRNQQRSVVVELWRNKISCDCSMKWFKAWIETLEENDPATKIRFQCRTPLRMYGKRSELLSPDDFVCNPNDKTFTDDKLEEAIHLYKSGRCSNDGLLALVGISSILSVCLVIVLIMIIMLWNNQRRRRVLYDNISRTDSEIRLTGI